MFDEPINQITGVLAGRLAAHTDTLIARGLDATLGKGKWDISTLPGRLLCKVLPDKSSTYFVDDIRMFTMTEPELVVEGGMARLNYQVIPYVQMDVEQQSNCTQDNKQTGENL